VVRYHDDYGRTSAGKVVAVSGGFDPVHLGHLYMFEEAKALAGEGGRLIAIVNCDAWLVRKKGRAFMNQSDRAKMVRAFSVVDDVYVLESDRSDVGEALERIRPHIFANGGDRRNTNEIPEAAVCEMHGIEMVFNVGRGGKIRSSSELLSTYAVKESGDEQK
jgi:D-beta-D-heptose 7-phosphate kinase/D-beta-D-heptose 1-phosphate adenosyltransferase